MKALTRSTRDMQARRLYAALYAAGYLRDEPEIGRFTARLGTALWQLGFYALILTDENLDLLPESVGADTELIGGDQESER